MARFGFVPLASSPPSASICALACSSTSFGTIEPTANSLSPFSVILQALHDLIVRLTEVELIHHAAGQQIRIAGVLDAHLPQHPRDDDLDVLIVDFDALAAVHVLNFTCQVLLHGFFAGDAKNIVRHERTIHQRVAGSHDVARVNAQVLVVRDQVLALDAAFAADDNRTLAALLLAEQFDRAVDLGDNGRILRLASFEDFRHARQTARDVLRTRGFARRLGDERTRRNHLAFVDFQVSPLGHVVEVENLAIGRVFDDDLRMHVALVFHDDEANVTAGVLFAAHRLAFDQVFEANLAAGFGQNRNAVRIPFAEHAARQQRCRFR